MNVLFVCTANSCRSQMAEAWGRHLFPADWQVASCGITTYPISRRTRWVMEEAGVGMDGQRPKEFTGVDLDAFDLIVSLSPEAGRFLPAPADPRRHVRRPVEDPMEADGDREEVRAAFRLGRDRIRRIVEDVRDGLIAPSGS